MGFIDDLYAGNVTPMENFGFSENPEYKALMQVVSDKEDSFMGTLEKEQKVSYQEIKSIREEIFNLEQSRLFEYAFRLACLLAIDIYHEKQ